MNLGETQSRYTRFILPAELIINRIQKRIHSRNTAIGLLNIDRTRTQMRIRQIDQMINSLDRLREKTEQIDINFARTRKIDYLDRYETLDQTYKHEKSSQYPIFRQSQQWRVAFVDEDKRKRICEKKCHLLENHLEALNEEIRVLQKENAQIDKENQLLTEQMTDVQSVPSITEYAQIIEEQKSLQHGIDIWTKRVKIAEVSAEREKERCCKKIRFGFYFTNALIMHHSNAMKTKSDLLLECPLTIPPAKQIVDCFTSFETDVRSSTLIMCATHRISETSSWLLQDTRRRCRRTFYR